LTTSSQPYSLQPKTYSLKMGIRFACPNGHKLNVKAFLAGKRGICPDCDAKFIVPQHSGALAVPIDSEVPAPAVPPPVVPSDLQPPSIAPVQQIAESLLRKPRSSSRKERAQKVSIILGILVLLLAGALVLVLCYPR